MVGVEAGVWDNVVYAPVLVDYRYPRENLQ